jgi:hypothetical protein
MTTPFSPIVELSPDTFPAITHGSAVVYVGSDIGATNVRLEIAKSSGQMQEMPTNSPVRFNLKGQFGPICALQHVDGVEAVVFSPTNYQKFL